MSEMSADHQVWLDAYQRIWTSPAELPRTACPRCGNYLLRLIFIVDDLFDRSGLAVFWCDSCMHGLMPSYAPLPEGGEKVLNGDEVVPNYSLVVEET